MDHIYIYHNSFIYSIAIHVTHSGTRECLNHSMVLCMNNYAEFHFRPHIEGSGTCDVDISKVTLQVCKHNVMYIRDVFNMYFVIYPCDNARCT